MAGTWGNAQRFAGMPWVAPPPPAPEPAAPAPSVGTWGRAAQLPFATPLAAPPPPFAAPPSPLPPSIVPPLESIEDKIARARPPAKIAGDVVRPVPKDGQFEDEVGPQSQDYYKYETNRSIGSDKLWQSRFMKSPITGKYRDSALFRPENWSSLTPNSRINGVDNTVKFAGGAGKGQENPFIDKTSDPPRTRPLEMTKNFAKVQLAETGLDPRIMDVIPLEIGELPENPPVEPGNVGRLGGEGGYYTQSKALLTGRGQLSLRPEDYGAQSAVAIHEAVSHFLEDMMTREDFERVKKLRRKYPYKSVGYERENDKIAEKYEDRFHVMTGWLDEYNEEGHPVPKEVIDFMNELISRFIKRAE